MSSRSGYDSHEDARMLKWVARHSSESPLGIHIWNNYVSHFTAPHTAQSLNGRMRRQIIPNICDYTMFLKLSELEILYDVFRNRFTAETKKRLKTHIKKLREKTSPPSYQRVMPPDDDDNDQEPPLDKSNEVSTTIHSDEDDEITSSTNANDSTIKNREDSRSAGPSTTHSRSTPNFKKFNSSGYSRNTPPTSHRGQYSFEDDSDEDSFANWTPRHPVKVGECSRSFPPAEDGDSDTSIKIPLSVKKFKERPRIDLETVSSRVQKEIRTAREEEDSDDSWKSPKQSRRVRESLRTPEKSPKKSKNAPEKVFPEDGDSDDPFGSPKGTRKGRKSAKKFDEEDSDTSTIPIKSPETSRRTEDHSRTVPVKELPAPVEIDSDDTEIRASSLRETPLASPKISSVSSGTVAEELPVVPAAIQKTPEQSPKKSFSNQVSPVSNQRNSPVREEQPVISEDEFGDDDDYVSPAPSPSQRMDVTSYFGVEMDDEDDETQVFEVRNNRQDRNVSVKDSESTHQTAEGVAGSSTKVENDDSAIVQQESLRSSRSPKKRLTNNSMASQHDAPPMRSPTSSKSPRKVRNNSEVTKKKVESSPKKGRKRSESAEPSRAPTPVSSPRKRNSEVPGRKKRAYNKRRRHSTNSEEPARSPKKLRNNLETEKPTTSSRRSRKDSELSRGDIRSPSPKKKLGDNSEVFQLSTEVSDIRSPKKLRNAPKMVQQEVDRSSEDLHREKESLSSPKKTVETGSEVVQCEDQELRSPSPKKKMENNSESLLNESYPETPSKERAVSSDTDELEERIRDSMRQITEVTESKVPESAEQSGELAGCSRTSGGRDEEGNEVDMEEANVEEVEAFRSHPKYLEYAHLPPKDDRPNYYWSKKSSGMAWVRVPNWILDGKLESTTYRKPEKPDKRRGRQKREVSEESKEPEEEEEEPEDEVVVEVKQKQQRKRRRRTQKPYVRKRNTWKRKKSEELNEEVNDEGGECSTAPKQRKRKTIKEKEVSEEPDETVETKPVVDEVNEEVGECSTSSVRKRKRKQETSQPKRISPRRQTSEEPEEKVEDHQEEHHEVAKEVGETSASSGGKRKSGQNRRKSQRMPKKNRRIQSLSISPTPDELKLNLELEGEVSRDVSPEEEPEYQVEDDDDSEEEMTSNSRKRKNDKNSETEQDEGVYYTVDMLGRRRKWKKMRSTSKRVSRAQKAALDAIDDEVGEVEVPEEPLEEPAVEPAVEPPAELRPKSPEEPPAEPPAAPTPANPETPKRKRGRPPRNKAIAVTTVVEQKAQLPETKEHEDLPGTSSASSMPSTSSAAQKAVEDPFSFESWNAKMRPVAEKAVRHLYEHIYQCVEDRPVSQKELTDLVEGDNVQQLFDKMFREEEQQGEEDFVIVNVVSFAGKKLRFKYFVRIQEELKKFNLTPHIRSAVLTFFQYFEYSVAATVDGKNFETYTILLDHLISVAMKLAVF